MVCWTWVILQCLQKLQTVSRSCFLSSIINASSGQHELRPVDSRENLIIHDECSVKPVKKGGVGSLENLVRMKEAEARMFQNREDEAQGEVESLRRIMRIKTEKIEEEYASRLAKLCLPELEERKRKKVEEHMIWHCTWCMFRGRGVSAPWFLP
ncbi:protein OBERON 3-like [Dorcoceras hygrometricum]|uniref:Protein OBERON 3-like n=1 Tax=Dorcoceras hygrometricum TaxID=472368 RepID=A0A2Z7AXK1_9LAMI|nr:protein OBERON 3-like [Dorcoceras hygrometricum]